MAKSKLEKQADEIMRLAEEKGTENNFLFSTTFERYLTQIKIADNLRETIEKEGTLTSKEYVKGRANVYTHPAVTDFNRTTDSANKTVSTLLRIIKNFEKADSQDEVDPLIEAINSD